MSPSSSQVRLPFDKLTESGLKPIIKKFSKWKCPVASVEAPNRPKRESGRLIKFFALTFEDGQKMIVRVKSDGTVFQVKLNNKVMPIKHVDDMDKAVREMIDYVQDNAKAYARAKIQREKKKFRPPMPPIITSRREKIDRARGELEQLSSSNAALEEQHVEMNGSIQGKREELKAADKALADERERTKELEARLSELEKAQGAQ